MNQAMGPPPRQRGRVNWAEVVSVLRESPSEAVLLPQFKQVDRARYLANAVNRKASPHLRMRDGRVVANVRNGTSRPADPGDLYLTFIPSEEDK